MDGRLPSEKGARALAGARGGSAYRSRRRRLAVVNTFSLVSLQMNTAIEATYNINVPRGISLAPSHGGRVSGRRSTLGARRFHTEWPY